MLKTLVNAVDCEEIRRRIAGLASESTRRWGSMSVGGMMCHLDDSYQLALGERPGARVSVPPPRRIQARLLDTVTRFSACSTLAQAQHPFFGPMSADDWLRWGYLHADHHLRQFSA